jgi:sulfate adenylyltransferase
MSLNLPEVILNERQLCDLECLATGIFSPLEGFMLRSEYESVLDRMRLQNGLLWPIPICLDVHEQVGRNLEVGQSIALRDPEGYLLAVLHIYDIWPVEKEKEAAAVYGTMDKSHPGVEYLLNQSGSYYVGGNLEVLNLPIHYDFKQLRLIPREVRQTIRKLAKEHVMSYQTTAPIHRPRFEMTLKAMRGNHASLLVLPITGITRPTDFDHFTRVRCYRQVARRYPPDSMMLNLLPLGIRMAGPRDAVLHAIISKNFGCTHFIVDYDHADPGMDNCGEAFYPQNEACNLSSEFGRELEMIPVPMEELVYLPFEDEFQSKSRIPEKSQYISLSGTDIWDRLRKGRKIPEWATFSQVITELQRAYPPPKKQGFTVFFTGLSGAGKSTIAKVLQTRFLEMGDRPVTLLDGDIVRRNLSSELTFSKEHRDINVRRIGFVASEITKNRGIAICAPIAPYETTRREIRKAIEQYGGFIEVHVSTPLEECEKRDRKGMYVKARAGLIKGFTGVDDPYELPEKCEIKIDTTFMTPEESAQQVLLYLAEKGFI